MMETGINQALKTGNGNALINTAIFAAILANCIPAPADAIYFYRQRIDKKELEEGKITPKQYWIRDTIGYYGYTALWYALVFGILQAAGGDYKTKARILLGLLGAGLVVGVVMKNIEEDQKSNPIQAKK